MLICDDDAIVRDALQGVLAGEEDLDLVGLAASGEDALERLEREPAEVVLMDLSLPGIDGITATARIRERSPGTRVLVLTASGSDEQVRAAVAAGAAGFLLKTTPSSALAPAIRQVARGVGTLLSPEVAARLAAGPGRSAPPPLVDPGIYGLSDRETEVLALVCAAASNAGIAARLVLSESTVKTHLTSLMAKLEVTSRLQLALRAFELGLVAAPRPEEPDGREG